MKGIGLGAGDKEDISKRKAKKIESEKLATGKESKTKRKVEARVGELGGALNGMRLGGE